MSEREEGEEKAAPRLLEKKKTGSILSANFPKDSEGRVYHVGVKSGEVHNRILTVGDPNRAGRISKLLDKITFERASNRGFVVINGEKNGVPISIIATGMGFPMVDFLIRETRAIVSGPMVFLRLGTCGTPASIPIGSVVVTDRSILVSRNVDAFLEEEGKEETCYYNVSKPVQSDPEFRQLVFDEMKGAVNNENVYIGTNATCDSFYSSQGRFDAAFRDENSSLLRRVLKMEPNTLTLEMESFHIFHLAKCCHSKDIKSAAAVIVLAQRNSDDFLPNEKIAEMESKTGEAALTALSKFKFSEK